MMLTSSEIEERRAQLSQELQAAVVGGRVADARRCQEEILRLPPRPGALSIGEVEKLGRGLLRNFIQADTKADRVQLQGAKWAAEEAEKRLRRARSRGRGGANLAELQYWQSQQQVAMQSARATSAEARALAFEERLAALEVPRLEQNAQAKRAAAAADEKDLDRVVEFFKLGGVNKEAFAKLGIGIQRVKRIRRIAVERGLLTAKHRRDRT